MNDSSTRSVLGAFALASMLGLAACANGNPPEGGDRSPGSLVTHRVVTTTAALPSAARTELITYLSEDATGQPVLVSGTVAIPRGEAPEGGWPVVSWAHGTTGVGDACAPSADTIGGPAHSYVSRAGAMLDRWVADGNVVVQTDYEGLGTPGGHPYMNGESARNSVVDIVRAARELDADVGSRWTVIGHSQGGHAALYTAAGGPDRAPELELQAAVVLAPGSRTSDVAGYFASGGPGIEQALSFLPVLLLGAEAADPSLSADAMLTDTARPLLAAARTGCMDDVREAAARVPVDNLFAPDADMSRLGEYYATQELESLTPVVPTLVVQGTADVLVSRAATDRITEALCGNGAALTYSVYDGADHRGVLEESFPETKAFVDKARTGDASTPTCG
ncbi:alpha/beta hydrolase family protein [Rhodococcus coprophilus]|uniref:Lipase n=1 Tax=Rhodococcus coprophilus TaxID=38310 RepID=A0A2X4U4S9_9NOCA|nr:lipase family protein [Rhodococcus coprophilus]MBM7461376.1 pimeloyl-ACP methyl ester carboxylesterase [Rhodococcus coprophilus]SQI29332.1 lipase [Rhodococcus coprophilus]